MPDTPNTAAPGPAATLMAHAAALAEIATLLKRDADRVQLEEMVLALAALSQRLEREGRAAAAGGGC